MKKIYFLALSLLLILPTQNVWAVTLINPLGEGATDVRVVIGRIIKAALGLSGSIALLMFIWGGFLWLTSAGKEEQVEKGKKTLTWATLGLIIIFGAYALTNAVIKAITTGSTT